MEENKKEKNHNKKPEVPGLNIPPEELQKLLMAQLQNRGAKGAANMKQMPVHMRFLNWVAFKCQTIITFLDRLINFLTKASDKDRNEVMQWSRAPIVFGTWVIIIVVGFGGLWSAFAPLDKAAVAIGTVISSTKKKVVQSSEQGIIKKILVRQGDEVREGQVLVELDDTRAKANFEQSLEEYRTHLANVNRLVAERDNALEVKYDDFLLQDLHSPRVTKIIEAQNRLFTSRRDAINGKLESLGKQINELRLHIQGLEAKKISVKKQMDVAHDRLAAAQKLFAQGVMNKLELQEQESKKAHFDSELANVNVEISTQVEMISRIEVEKINTSNNYLSDLIRELKDTQFQATNAFEKYINAKETLSHVTVRSPVDGIVNNVLVSTIGGVIHPKDELVEVTPKDDDLVIEAKISPKNIDSVHAGLNAKIRFSAFKSRTTPVFVGKVIYVSPDVVRDDSAYARMGQSEPYSYVARIELDAEEFSEYAAEHGLVLHPGMTAEVYIVTGTRTLLRYLLDPLIDQMFESFVEK
jgi:HlyD family type I secretion membrane fusion protein